MFACESTPVEGPGAQHLAQHYVLLAHRRKLVARPDELVVEVSRGRDWVGLLGKPWQLDEVEGQVDARQHEKGSRRQEHGVTCSRALG